MSEYWAKKQFQELQAFRKDLVALMSKGSAVLGKEDLVTLDSDFITNLDTDLIPEYGTWLQKLRIPVLKGVQVVYPLKTI